MSRIGWRFPPLQGGTKQGFNNNDIEAFRGKELIDNLAREICQNSLDARNEYADGPVKVRFELREVSSAGCKAFSEYAPCIEACREYYSSNMDNQLEAFLNDAAEMLSRKTIPVLLISDYNTKGLYGSRGGDDFTPWVALTSADGISAEKGDTSGGSFGIGKNAPFACSAMRMVFYNTHDKDGDDAFIGVGRLATFRDSTNHNQETQRVGRYQHNDDENLEWHPIYPDQDDDEFSKQFQRKETGTDVIIAGFSFAEGWTADVRKAVIKNFFVAISEGMLVVEIVDGADGGVIDSGSIGDLVERYAADKDMASTFQLYQAFTKPDDAKSLSVFEEDDVQVYVRSRPEYGRKIAYFRNTGMLVEETYRQLWQHYAAVVVVRGEEIAKILRETEPARHNQWDHKRIPMTRKEDRKKAKEAIAAIHNGVADFLRSQYEVSSEEAIDAVGAGDYLPDDGSASTEGRVGDDALRPRIKIGKVRHVVPKDATDTVRGKKSQGEPVQGEVHNDEDSPRPTPTDPPTPRVNPDQPGEGSKGVAPGPGTKTVTVPRITRQRTFQVSPGSGLYKSVLKPEETIEKAAVVFKSIGEDGSTEKLMLEAFTCNGKRIIVDDGVAGPMRLEGGQSNVCYATFAKKEKMRVRTQVIGV